MISNGKVVSHDTDRAKETVHLGPGERMDENCGKERVRLLILSQKLREKPKGGSRLPPVLYPSQNH